jgi:predicted deacetylase
MRAVCIAIHDVAPATMPACERLFDLITRLGAPPATLLVVPDFHRRGRVERDLAFVRAIDRRLANGDEVALHGHHHVDDGPVPHSPFEWLQRRVLTASEGEFSALTQHEAEQRIGAGLAMFDRLRWNARGFVAPAWLLGDGARAALARTTLRWTSTHGAIESLADARRFAAPAISTSARRAWRRWTSRRWLALANTALRAEPLVRVALHPADVADAALVDAWRVLIGALLAERIALTKSDALARAIAPAVATSPARA